MPLSGTIYRPSSTIQEIAGVSSHSGPRKFSGANSAPTCPIIGRPSRARIFVVAPRGLEQATAKTVSHATPRVLPGQRGWVAPANRGAPYSTRIWAPACPRTSCHLSRTVHGPMWSRHVSTTSARCSRCSRPMHPRNPKPPPVSCVPNGEPPRGTLICLEQRLHALLPDLPNLPARSCVARARRTAQPKTATCPPPCP